MDFEQQLLTSSQGPQVAPELLELLGTNAATAFVENGTPLSDAVKQQIASHQGLNNEHVKRVVEFANNRAFRDMFERSQDKNVHFPVADPGDVIRSLRDGSSPANAGQTMGGSFDYKSNPAGKTEHNAFADPESALQSLFTQNDHSGIRGQGDAIEKVASYEGHANPIDDVYDQYVKLRAMQDNLRNTHESLDLLVKEAGEHLYQEVKREVLSEGGLGMPGAVSLLQKLGHDPSLIQSALGAVAHSLQTRDGIAPERQATHEHQVKTASLRLPNGQHPIHMAFCGLVKVAQDKVTAEAALADVTLGLERTSRFLHEMIR
jgi:hypothetical protein